jgi:hypothetical protein
MHKMFLIKFSIFIQISVTLCSTPILNIDQMHSQQNPMLIYRSKQLIINTETLFSCNLTKATQYEWFLIQLNSNLNDSLVIINNPTIYSSTLVLQSNTLDYGIYKFKFTVKITMTNDGSVFTNDISTYVQVIPTGLVVYALQNGIQSILIGSNQTLIFNPVLYSFDMDNFVSPQLLEFKFFCQKVNSSAIMENIENSQIDLYQYKMNNSVMEMFSNLTCFDSNGIYNKI